MADPDLLRASREALHPAGVHALRGRRFAAISEADEDVKLDEALLKRLSGTETMTSRGMGENFSSFRREAKIWLAVNSRPKLRGRDEGLWRRIVSITWPVEFVDPGDPDKPIDAGPKRRLLKDPVLDEALKAEAPGILATWVRACRDWQTDGLLVPEPIRKETKQYRQNLDTVRRYIATRCETKPCLECPGEFCTNRTATGWHPSILARRSSVRRPSAVNSSDKVTARFAKVA